MNLLEIFGPKAGSAQAQAEQIMRSHVDKFDTDENPIEIEKNGRGTYSSYIDYYFKLKVKKSAVSKMVDSDDPEVQKKLQGKMDRIGASNIKKLKQAIVDMIDDLQNRSKMELLGVSIDGKMHRVDDESFNADKIEVPGSLTIRLEIPKRER